MNARIKKLWVTALRSGRWVKHMGSLRSADNHRCCLGVLCEVFVDDTSRGGWNGKIFIDGIDNASGSLPVGVLKWSGLNDEEGDEVQINGEICKLAKHNDDRRPRSIPFTEIADAIEEQL